MSWDILIINSNGPVDFEKGDWASFESRQSVIDCIRKTFPDSNWDDLSWGILDNENAVIEFNIGGTEQMDNTFMLHVRGGQDPTGEIVKMCNQSDWIAYDISNDQFINNSNPSTESFKEWESYRDHVVSGATNKRPWWKLW